MKLYVTWTNMKADVETFVKHCHLCQIGQKTNIEETANVFEVIAADIMGPIQISEEDGNEYKYILSVVDIKSHYVEIVALKSTTGDILAKAIDDNWLCRYPRPLALLTDNGSNLICGEVTSLLNSYNVKHKYSTTYNPQCNSIIERTHGTINEYLRILGLNNWHLKLQPIAWFMRSSYHRSIENTPGKLIFNRDMLMQHEENITKSKERKDRTKDLDRENKHRIKHVYSKNDFILLQNPKQTSKFDRKWLGPFVITDVYPDSNYVVITRENQVLEKVNIRRIVPYFTSSGRQNVVSTTKVLERSRENTETHENRRIPHEFSHVSTSLQAKANTLDNREKRLQRRTRLKEGLSQERGLSK